MLVNYSTSCDTKSNSEFRSAKKIEITLSREAKLQIRDGRGILLRNVVCWIAEKDFPTGLGQVLLVKEALHRLGYSPRQMLHNTRLRMTDVDFDRVENEGDLQKETVGVCIQHEEVDFTEEKKVLVRTDGTNWFPEIQDQDPTEVQHVLKNKVAEAKCMDVATDLPPKCEEYL